MKANEIREKLMELGYSEADVSKLKGKELVNTLQSEMNNDSFFDNLEEEEKQTFTQKSVDETKVKTPKPGDVEWEDYVLSHFTPDEFDTIQTKFGNSTFPRTSALRRVCEKLLGPIVESGPTYISPATDSDGPGRVTVFYTVKIRYKHDYPDYITVDENFQEPIRTYTDGACAWAGNMSDVYTLFPTSVAITRAEGRCLRKALMLSVVSSEELLPEGEARDKLKNIKKNVDLDTEDTGYYPIMDGQAAAIASLCKRLNIDITKFIQMHCGKTNVESLLKSEARTALALLNKYQSTGSESEKIPVNILCEEN